MLSDLQMGDVLLHILNMIILFVIVRFLVYKPMRKFMAAREQRIAAALAEAEKARGEADALHAQAGTIIAEAEASARVKALEVAAQADEAARAMTESAREEGLAIVEKAKADAMAERELAIAGMRGEVIDLAAAMAEQILAQNEGGDAL
ncbi:MAG: ATP synthase F0 subunit B [Firmicutes bacterium]|nr:ATP synthase F0 subunit B [Bacillota bacterium]